MEKRAASLQGLPFSNRGSANDSPKGTVMIIFVTVKLKKLFKKSVIIHGPGRKAVCAVVIIKYGYMVMPGRFLMVIKGHYSLSFIVVMFVPLQYKSLGYITILDEILYLRYCFILLVTLPQRLRHILK